MRNHSDIANRGRFFWVYQIPNVQNIIHFTLFLEALRISMDNKAASSTKPIEVTQAASA